MDDRVWICDILKDILESLNNVDKIKDVLEDYKRIKDNGKVDTLLKFIENEYDKEFAIQMELYLFNITADTAIYLVCAKNRLELEKIQNDDLFFEMNLLEQIYIHEFCKSESNFEFELEWNSYLERKMEREIFNDNKHKINLKRRNKDQIVLVTKQLLGLQHAPTVLVLEIARILKNILNKEVFLLVAGVDTDGELLKNNFTIADARTVNFDRNLNGTFCKRYKDTEIRGYQLLLKKENKNEMKEVLEKIYQMSPWVVWEIGGHNYYAGITQKFTSYICTQCVSGYPAVQADMIVNYIPCKSPEEKEKKFFLENKGTLIKETEFLFEYEKPWQPAVRENYGIKDGEFILGIVGNRLNEDCREDFVNELAKAIRKIQNVGILFYGEVSDDFKEYMREMLGANARIIYVGYKKDMINYLGMMDLFVNPPRLGGGNGAAMSMSLGIPVLTTEKGDVASVAGDSFTVDKLEDFHVMIQKYEEDENYRRKQGDAAKKRIGEMTTSDEQLGDILQSILNMVEETEKK